MIKEKSNMNLVNSWKNLPLPKEIKELVIGRSCFSKTEKELLEITEGYYKVLAKNCGKVFEQINDVLDLLILDNEGNVFQIDIK